MRGVQSVRRSGTVVAYGRQQLDALDAPAYDPSVLPWKNYGDFSRGHLGAMYPNSNYTGAAITDGQQVKSISTGPYGTRGLKESAITGPTYYDTVNIGAYSGPGLYFGGGKRLIGDAASYSDFGHETVMVQIGIRQGPSAGTIFAKGNTGSADGTLALNVNAYRAFNGNADTGLGLFQAAAYELHLFEWTHDWSTGIIKVWRNRTLAYSGTAPGNNGGNLWTMGQGAGGYTCADFYVFKWAMAGSVIADADRAALAAHWGY